MLYPASVFAQIRASRNSLSLFTEIFHFFSLLFAADAVT